MAEVIEHHDGWTDEIEHPGYSCTCGRGFSENNSYGVGAGDPCDLCGPPLVREVQIEYRNHPSYVLIRCDCGDLVRCQGFTNTCDRCGADYNWNGDRLADRQFWGEETRETDLDLLSVDRFGGLEDR